MISEGREKKMMLFSFRKKISKAIWYQSWGLEKYPVEKQGMFSISLKKKKKKRQKKDF